MLPSITQCRRKQKSIKGENSQKTKWSLCGSSLHPWELTDAPLWACCMGAEEDYVTLLYRLPSKLYQVLIGSLCWSWCCSLKSSTFFYFAASVHAQDVCRDEVQHEVMTRTASGMPGFPSKPCCQQKRSREQYTEDTPCKYTLEILLVLRFQGLVPHPFQPIFRVENLPGQQELTNHLPF